MLRLTNTLNILVVSALLLILSACSVSVPYKAYFGDLRKDVQLATLDGQSFRRVEMLNRYTDTVNFMEVDGIPVMNSNQYRAMQIEPGLHEIKVYFSWDLGVQRGLAPAMVDYARHEENISRTLRFNAQAGEEYTVMAGLVFNGKKHDITTLCHVDFWIEDQVGNEIVSRENGRYIPNQQSRC